MEYDIFINTFITVVVIILFCISAILIKVDSRLKALEKQGIKIERMEVDNECN